MLLENCNVFCTEVAATSVPYKTIATLSEGTEFDCQFKLAIRCNSCNRNNLKSVLVRLGVLQESAKIENQLQFEEKFKNVWADHADMISIQYSGTGALKTDFTRYRDCSIEFMFSLKRVKEKVSFQAIITFFH